MENGFLIRDFPFPSSLIPVPFEQSRSFLPMLYPNHFALPPTISNTTPRKNTLCCAYYYSITRLVF